MIRVTCDTHTAEELYDLSRLTADERYARRLRALAMVLEGCSRGLTARAQGVDTTTLARWVRRYNAEGLQGLRSRPSGGSRCRLDERQQATVKGWMDEGPDLERDGVTRWRVADIRDRIEREFGVEYTVEGVRRLLRRLGFRHVSARPLHPKADPERQQAFREGFEELVKAAVKAGAGAGLEGEDLEAAQEEAAGKPVEIWFQDEARIGQKGMLTRVWAGRNTRPRIERDHRYGYCYLFAAACEGRQEAVGLVAPKANTEWMNEHLAAISAAVSEGAVGVVVLDGAGWHRSGDLAVPENLRLLVLPPYSPELNPVEQIFQYLKANRFANRVFATVDAVIAACEAAWKWLCLTPERIASILHREWVAGPQTAC